MGNWVKPLNLGRISSSKNKDFNVISPILLAKHRVIVRVQSMKGGNIVKDKSIHPPLRTLCINTEKVYDWIIEESTGSTSVPVGTLPVPLPANAANVQVGCMLTDATGAPFPVNGEVLVTETAPREDHQFEIDGGTVTLQRITFTKTLYAVLQVTGTDPATGMQFSIASTPRPFNFIKMVFLCAPVGTSLVVRVSNFSCLTTINRNTEGEITGFGLVIFVCQSVQTVAPVTIEISANLCRPRDQISEQCPDPRIPPQCPNVFPRA